MTKREPAFIRNPIYRGARGGDASYYLQNVCASQKPLKLRAIPGYPGMRVLTLEERMQLLELQEERNAKLERLQKREENRKKALKQAREKKAQQQARIEWEQGIQQQRAAEEAKQMAWLSFVSKLQPEAFQDVPPVDLASVNWYHAVMHNIMIVRARLGIGWAPLSFATYAAERKKDTDNFKEAFEYPIFNSAAPSVNSPLMAVKVSDNWMDVAQELFEEFETKKNHDRK